MPIKDRWQSLMNKASLLSNLSISELNSRKLPGIYYRYSVYLILQNEGYCLSSIARISNKHHATIIHDIEEIKQLITYNSLVKEIYQSLLNTELEEEIKYWLTLPESSDPIKTAIHFYQFK